MSEIMKNVNILCISEDQIDLPIYGCRFLIFDLFHLLFQQQQVNKRLQLLQEGVPQEQLSDFLGNPITAPSDATAAQEAQYRSSDGSTIYGRKTNYVEDQLRDNFGNAITAPSDATAAQEAQYRSSEGSTIYGRKTNYAQDTLRDTYGNMKYNDHRTK